MFFLTFFKYLHNQFLYKVKSELTAERKMMKTWSVH